MRHLTGDLPRQMAQNSGQVSGEPAGIPRSTTSTPPAGRRSTEHREVYGGYSEYQSADGPLELGDWGSW